MVHEVQGQESELHDKICVIDIGSFSFPRPFVVEVPEVNYVSAVNTENVILVTYCCSLLGLQHDAV